MGQHRFSRVLQFACVVAIALTFFLVGYCARTARIASAQVPHPTPSFISDGDPSGHQLIPRGRQLTAVNADLEKCLKMLANARLAIRYVTAHPGGSTAPLTPPKCTTQPCVQFVWRNMQLTNKWPNETHGPRVVDVYGTIALQ